MFEDYRTFETCLSGRKLIIETGKTGMNANGSCIVRYGDTVVQAAVCSSKKARENEDFFPLSVDYQERLYAVGKIPGNYLKREGRPTEKAIITGRLIDRQIRPLFPKNFRNEVTLSILVLSVERDCRPEIAAMIGASTAISISDIPWNGPTAGVTVGMAGGKYILDPGAEDMEKSSMCLTVAGTADKVVMIEASAKEVPNDVLYNGIVVGQREVARLTGFISHIREKVGRPKFAYEPFGPGGELFSDVESIVSDRVIYTLDTKSKTERDTRTSELVAELSEELSGKYPDSTGVIYECVHELQKRLVRKWILDDGKRVDGRPLDGIRPLAAEVGILPRCHGSALFTRGQTQVLTVATLGPTDEKQMLDGIDFVDSKRYIHHYNMPSWSVGETRTSHGPGRREIGHGALAERALVPVLPSEEEFPYSIRLVSEVLSSNGSTSQASVCASTLALMDAGVPVSAPVAGISCGLVDDGARHAVLVDIQGLEDFFGDMDFKVAGTLSGITAIQLDIKTDGLSFEIIRETLEKAKNAREIIIRGVMKDAIPAPRAEVSQYAPKIIASRIDVEKIRDLIGPGGKVIQKICAECACKINVLEDGRVFISANDEGCGNAALKFVQLIANGPKVGEYYKGRVTRTQNFGAFVEIAPGKEGLVHISKLDIKHVDRVEDIVKPGDEITVKLTGIDDRGRLDFSRRDVLIEQGGLTRGPEQKTVHGPH